MKKLLKISTLILIFLACSKILAGTYYVSPSGNDSDSGNFAAPWETIQHAADVAVAGDTINILPGIYRETIEIENSGTPDLPIIFRADSGTNTAFIYGSEKFGNPDSSETYKWQQLTGPEIDLPTGVDWSKVYKVNLPNWIYTRWDGVHTSQVEIVALVDAATNNFTRLQCARTPNWTVDFNDVFQRVHYHSNFWTADGSTVSNNTGQRWLTDVDRFGVGTYNSLIGARAFVLDNKQGHYMHRAFVDDEEFNNNRIHFDIDIDHEGIDGIGICTKYYIENDTEFMDQPGEWTSVNNGLTSTVYVLTGTGGAYGISLPASDLEKIEISKRHKGFVLTGCSNITFDSLSFRFINKDDKRKFYNGEQGAFVINNDDDEASSNIVFDKIEISHGCMGFFLAQETGSGNKISRIILKNSYIHNMDNSGFYLSQWPYWQPTGNEDIRLISNRFYKIGFRPLIDGSLAVSIANSINQFLFRNNYIGYCAHNGMQIQNPNPGIILVENNVFEWNCLCCTDAGGFKFHSSDLNHQSFSKALVKGNLSRYNYGWTYAAEQNDLSKSWIPDSRKGMRGHGFYVDVAGGISFYRNIAVENGKKGLSYSAAYREGTNYIFNNTFCRGSAGVVLDDVKKNILMTNTKIKNNLFVNNLRNNTTISQSKNDSFNDSANSISDLPGLEIDYNVYRLPDSSPNSLYVFEYAHNDGEIQYESVKETSDSSPCEYNGFQTNILHLVNEDGDSYNDFSPAMQISPVCDTGEIPTPIIELIGWLNTNYLMIINEPEIEDVYMYGPAYDIGAIEFIPEPGLFINYYLLFIICNLRRKLII